MRQGSTVRGCQILSEKFIVKVWQILLQEWCFVSFLTLVNIFFLVKKVFSSILLGTTFLHDSFKAFGWTFFQENPMAIHGVCILIVLPALLIDTLYGFAWLALVSFIAMMSSLLGFSGMMFESMSGSGVSESWKEFTVVNFPRFVGSICLCLGGVTMMLPIRSEMKEPESFRRVFRTSFFTSATVLILFGLVANLAFGNISFLYQIRSWHPKSIVRPFPRDKILLHFRIRIDLCGNGASELPNVPS
jgi:hypothetical protein